MAETLGMNFRVSFILLVLLALVGGYVFFFELQRPPKRSTQPVSPWFYDISTDDIVKISVTHQDKRQAFVKTNEGWVFEDTKEPVNLDRWGGITLLLSGPRTSRVLEAEVKDPAEFGLSPPVSVFSVTLKNGKSITMRLGDTTPEGVSHYAQVEGIPTLFSLPSSWGEVISRLATEPPVVTPTVTPESTPTAIP